MCGIAAILRLGGRVEQHEITAMIDAQAHRGPDGGSLKLWDNCALGHRRLSIIDLERGTQPMCNEDESIWITYNGEIYNFRSLRDQLIQKGHLFKTQSDTEVIIHAYEEWGQDCVLKLRGMFAFCILDENRRQLFLARDHFGIKPLYYFNWGGTFACASELRSLRTLDAFPMALDLSALDQYLWLQYIPAPQTIFKRVKKLPPAHSMIVDFDGTAHDPVQYWDCCFAPDTTKTESQWLEEVDSVLRDSVQSHLVADVPFGAFLSGGIDSSMVTMYMSQLLEKPVKTFSIGFDEKSFSELSYARRVAETLGTEHYEHIVRSDALEILPDLVSHYGEPFGDSSAIPTYYVSKLARQHVPMVLSGDGGDEAFGGYHRYMGWLNVAEERTVDRWLQFVQYLSLDWRKRLWREDYHHVIAEQFPLARQAFLQSQECSPTHRAQDIDRRTYLPFDLLTKVDTASMMHGLEVRTPFVDTRVWELASRIPEEMNVRMTQGKWEGKMLLKKLAERQYAKDHVYRYKMGFGVPLEYWFGDRSAYRDELEQRLLSSGSLLSEYFDPSVIKDMMDKKLSSYLWLLLFMDEWLRQFETVPTSTQYPVHSPTLVAS